MVDPGWSLFLLQTARQALSAARVRNEMPTGIHRVVMGENDCEADLVLRTLLYLEKFEA